MRLPRVDAFRVYSMLLILFAHMQYFGRVDFDAAFTRPISVVIVVVARATIQFFFIAAGFFLGGQILTAPEQARSLAWKYTSRLLFIFAFWCLVYEWLNPGGFLILLKNDPLRLTFEGTRLHLWYLPALILSVWMYALWPQSSRGSWGFVAFTFGLSVIGLLAGAYRHSALGLDMEFNARNGPFFGPLFFGIGAYLQSRPRPKPNTAVWLYLLGLFLFSVESYFLWARWGMDPIKNDYLLGSIPMGIGFFLFALLFDASRLDKLIAPLGKYMFGIYLIHLAILEYWLKRYHASFDPLIWQLTLPLILGVVSLALVYVISRTPLRTIFGIKSRPHEVK